jgi:hypothetical protein
LTPAEPPLLDRLSRDLKAVRQKHGGPREARTQLAGNVITCTTAGHQPRDSAAYRHDAVAAVVHVMHQRVSSLTERTDPGEPRIETFTLEPSHSRGAVPGTRYGSS